ncbi:retroviral-like aspartic protease family protein [bacterium]|nr:retroviral-like aspartic protease family protein [bacterium]
MKIPGYWGRFDAAYVDVRFVSKKFGVDEIVPFLIDLGASSTIISDKDAQNLGIDYSRLQKLKKGVTGIGGRAKTYLMEEVDLFFDSDAGLYRAQMDHRLVIKHALKQGSKVGQVIPSLLGRDFLNQMALIVDKRKDLVLMTDEDFTV